ncbi:cation:proton antiporter domain-containing protein [Tsukamurella ocularis]|uniref:cation:proton antiporter domain-containing protein n=1 Tax=Tsukamurella ocularis TaxID=1970234 RepID=UPI0021672542|nr:cation:proton antiporter [Tsukamurella ocularis]MCS3780491.1 NhaP-type Na+/H+ or K+/H+ antiporter [Tsukamurella ocularis]MCS3785954.1 NhaP-type Na+/H+ or K+/H+ antiporter [Tsukamurella ocularis]MCS3849318.1 NhaP-type Na+/H+ or K+/H+ antiporter [Tsukamurella ocularis]
MLTVESGYTDGLVTPLFLFALYWAGPGHGDDDPAPALLAAAPQAAIALAVGAALGAMISVGVQYAERAGLTSDSGRRLAIAATPLLTYAAAVGLGGNGFVAAFVCGIVYRLRRGTSTVDDVGLTDDLGFLLTAAMWFVFGSVAVVGLFDGIAWQTVLFVVATLTLCRVLPIGVAMAGGGLPRREVLQLGWLRPRGTSTIVFALIAFNTLPDGRVADLTLGVAVLVVLGSIVLHTVGVPVAVAGHDRRARGRA